LVQERSTVLTDAARMLRFLFVDPLVPDPDAAAKNLDAEAVPVLEAALTSLDGCDDWKAAGIEAALRTALVEGLGLKPRKAFGPVRVAVTGRTVSPPLYESLELLGRERSLARLRAGVERARAVG
jgi:glutamyl-tRNA synthetase